MQTFFRCSNVIHTIIPFVSKVRRFACMREIHIWFDIDVLSSIESERKTIWFCKTQYENKNKERTENFKSGCRHKELNLNPNIDLRNG